MKAKKSGHACTAEEAQHIESLVWKYFSRKFAENVMIAYGRKKGNRKRAYDDYQGANEEWNNRKKAADEIGRYIDERHIYDIDQAISEEATAVIYESGFIF